MKIYRMSSLNGVVKRPNRAPVRLRNWLKVSRYHLFFWLVYSLYECIIAQGYQVNIGSPQMVVLMFALNIAFFYLFAHVVLAKIRGELLTDHLALLFRVVIWFVLYISLKVFVVQLQNSSLSWHSTNLDGLAKLISGQIFRCGHFAFMAAVYYYYNKREQERGEKYTLLEVQFKSQLLSKQSKSEIESAFFMRWRKQFDPHFIYSLFTYLQAKAVPDEADHIVALAKLLQHHTHTSLLAQEVKLQSELDCIRLNLELRALLSPLKVALQIAGDEISNLHVICPMLLVPLSNLILEQTFAVGADFTLVIHVLINEDQYKIEFRNISIHPKEEKFDNELLPFHHNLHSHYGKKANLKVVKHAGLQSLLITIPVA